MPMIEKYKNKGKVRFILCLLIAVVLITGLLCNCGTIGAAGPSKITVSKKKIAVDVGFYTSGQPGEALSKARIKKQLKAIKKYANTVRFYGSADALAPAYKIAHDMGFKVVGTAWLSGNTSADKKEMKALIKHCNKGYVSVACVGSETLKRGDLSADQLISDMKYVKKNLKKKVPVTTADDTDFLLANPSVCNNCDVLLLNAYPYWGGVDVSAAAGAFDATVQKARDQYPKKNIIISETGWPTAGGQVGQAKAGSAQSQKYFREIRAWSLKNKIPVLWFEAADEPWKAADEGKAGAHWGLMTKKLQWKKGFKVN